MATLVAALAACSPTSDPKPPPAGAFYFPTGLMHLDGRDGGEGFLYVASSNFDKRFDYGQVTAVDLAGVAGSDGGVLPAFGGKDLGAPTQLDQLNLAEGARVFVQSFAGEMDVWRGPDGETTLFVPSRAEGHRVHAIEVADAKLTCRGDPETPNCIAKAESLVQLERKFPDGGTNASNLPRAPEPIGVAVSGDTVYVTHIQYADSPIGTNQNQHTYLFNMSAGNPVVDEKSFIDLGGGGSHGIALGTQYAFITGRYINPFAYLVRLVNLTNHEVQHAFLESDFRVLEARGIALSADQRRLYVAGRAPDTLLKVAVDDPTGAAPRLRVVATAPLADGANTVKLIPRGAGKSDLVAVTSSGAGVLQIFLAEPLVMLKQIPGLGQQPYGIAIDHRGSGARLFISNFADGRVAVVDLPSLDDLTGARLVAHLGASQTCLTQIKDAACAVAAP